jgi:GAF domain-containing protein
VATRICTFGEKISVARASDAPSYDPSIDSDPDYTPRSLLAMPLKNSSGSPIGGLIVLTKLVEGEFLQVDENVLTGLMVAAEIALTNMSLYRRGHRIISSLRSMIADVVHGIAQIDLRGKLESLIQKAMVLVGASRVTLFAVDANGLMQYLNAGIPNTAGTRFADTTVTNGRVTSFSEAELRQLSPTAPKSTALSSSRFARVSSVFSVALLAKAMAPVQETLSEGIYSIPLFSAEESLLGVLEVELTKPLNSSDKDFLQSVGHACGLVIAELNPGHVSASGLDGLDAGDWMTAAERSSCALPPKFVILDDVFAITFDPGKLQGIGTFRLVFGVFDRFHLIEAYRIPANTLFQFLMRIQACYSRRGYYTWNHAVSVCHHAAFLVAVGKIDKGMIGQFEVLALIVAALAHDARHCDEVALLRKERIAEMRSIAAAVSVMGEEDCDIFETMPASDLRSMWNLVIDLIMATNMASHGQILREVQVLMDTDMFNPGGDPNHKLLLLKLIIKAADFADVWRPLADPAKWTPDIADEFFAQAELVGVRDLVYKDDVLDREASMMAFLKNICLPLAQLLSRAVPLLRTNTEVLKDNIQKWARRTGRPVPNFEPEKRR